VEEKLIVMRTAIILIAIWFGLPNVCRAQNEVLDTLGWPLLESVPAAAAVSNYVSAPESFLARHILPEDIVQDSFKLVRFSKNSFAVRLTYTETGAKKILAFNEVHQGQQVRLVIGSFETSPHAFIFRPMPPSFTNYTEWKQGWLKYRTDKIFTASEADAKKIAAGLKSK